MFYISRGASAGLKEMKMERSDCGRWRAQQAGCGELAYLNRIDDLLNVDPARTTSLPLAFLMPFLSRDEGWGLTASLGLVGARGAAWALADLLTGLSLRWRGWITPRHDGYHLR